MAESTSAYPKHGKHAKRSSKLLTLLKFLVSFLVGCAVIACAAGFAYIQARNIDVTTTTPQEIAEDFYHAVYAELSGTEYQSRYAASSSSADEKGHATLPGVIDVTEKEKASSSSSSSSSSEEVEPTPYIAEFQGMYIHSLVQGNELTGILFHQASYDYALVLETKLREADPERVLAERKMDTGDGKVREDGYVDAEAVHGWRPEVTAMDTSIDVGSQPGNTVVAPVSGTVVLVREYDLFDQIKDFEVHIQPDGRKDLDVVVIHITDVCVKPADKVIGGVTPIAKVRDLIGEGIYDIQLGTYIDAYSGDHSHVQVNDVNFEDYRKKRLEGSYTVPE